MHSVSHFYPPSTRLTDSLCTFLHALDNKREHCLCSPASISSPLLNCNPCRYSHASKDTTSDSDCSVQSHILCISCCHASQSEQQVCSVSEFPCLTPHQQTSILLRCFVLSSPRKLGYFFCFCLTVMIKQEP